MKRLRFRAPASFVYARVTTQTGRDVHIQTMRALTGGTGGRDDKEYHHFHQQKHHGHPSGELSSEDVGNGDSSAAANSSVFRDAGGNGGGGRRGLFAPTPQRPDRSPSPALQGGSLENSPAAAAGGASPLRRQAGRSPSPIADLMRRASFPANARPWNFLDLRGGHGLSRYRRIRRLNICLGVGLQGSFLFLHFLLLFLSTISGSEDDDGP